MQEATSEIDPIDISRASVAEVAASVDLMRVFGLTREDKAESLKSRLTKISKMLWGLMR